MGAGILIAFQTLSRDAQELAPEMFWREFDRVKYHVDDARAPRNPMYYQDREVLTEQTDWLNKAGARSFWVYSRRRQQNAVLLRTLDVKQRLGQSERDAVREDSGARYGNDLARVQAELRLRYRWLEERRYQLKPRALDKQTGRAAPGTNGHRERQVRAEPPASAAPTPEPAEAPDDPFA